MDTQETGGRKDASRFWLYLTRGGVLSVELVSEEARFAAASQQARALLGHLGIVEQEEYDDPNAHDWISVTPGDYRRAAAGGGVRGAVYAAAAQGARRGGGVDFREAE